MGKLVLVSGPWVTIYLEGLLWILVMKPQFAHQAAPVEAWLGSERYAEEIQRIQYRRMWHIYICILTDAIPRSRLSISAVDPVLTAAAISCCFARIWL